MKSAQFELPADLFHRCWLLQLYFIIIIIIIVLLTLTDHLFEVAVEVNFSQDLESWDEQARSLLMSVKTLVRWQKAKRLKEHVEKQEHHNI